MNRFFKKAAFAIGAGAIVSLTTGAKETTDVPGALIATTGGPDRTTLPIHEPQYPHSTVLDVRNATPPPRFEVKAPAGAPNVLIILIDDNIALTKWVYLTPDIQIIDPSQVRVDTAVIVGARLQMVF